MSTHHLVNNAQKGNFEAAVQVFQNYKDGAPDFEKNEKLALDAFENSVSILLFLRSSLFLWLPQAYKPPLLKGKF